MRTAGMLVTTAGHKMAKGLYHIQWQVVRWLGRMLHSTSRSPRLVVPEKVLVALRQRQTIVLCKPPAIWRLPIKHERRIVRIAVAVPQVTRLKENGQIRHGAVAASPLETVKEAGCPP